MLSLYTPCQNDIVIRHVKLSESVFFTASSTLPLHIPWDSSDSVFDHIIVKRMILHFFLFNIRALHIV